MEALNSLDSIIAFINSEVGTDLSSLQKAKEVLKEAKLQKIAFEEKLSSASREVPGKINLALAATDDAHQKVALLSGEKEQLSCDIANHVADVKSLVNKISETTNQIKELEKYAKYLQLISKIEDLSSDIQSALIIGSTDRSVSQFSLMVKLAESIKSSRCTNLVSFINDTVLFWHEIIKGRLVSDFDDVLKAWQWPFIIATTRVTPLPNASELKAKLDDVVGLLLKLQLPELLDKEEKLSHPFVQSLPDWQSPILPIKLMLKPIEKRFSFHFCGKKQTNNNRKPEWYFTQTLTWIRDHKGFLQAKIQPILDKSGLGHKDAIVEFIRGLVALVIDKMMSDVKDILDDEQLFCHLVDEALSFNQELTDVYGYPPHHGCLNVLIRDECFARWLDVERKLAMEKMDTMLSASTAWNSQYGTLADVDDSKLPECAGSFMTLMLAIAERSKSLPSTKHQLYFLDLQLDLMDDFRIRLLQITRSEAGMPLGQRYTVILNTVGYLAEVLKDWNELMFFVKLQHWKRIETDRGIFHTVSDSSILDKNVKTQSSFEIDDIKSGVFDETIQLLEHMKSEMVRNIASNINEEVRLHSQQYCKDKWMTLPSQKLFVSLGLSVSALQMFLVLKDLLHQAETLLCKDLFEKVWQNVAEFLNDCFFKELILANHFNEGGASQLQFDMTRNLFPLFGQYTQKPENYFKDIKEACILLNLNVGSALLVREVLKQALDKSETNDNSTPADPIAGLHEVNVFKLEPDVAAYVLSLRTDLMSM